jgi:hypothetical protein
MKACLNCQQKSESRFCTEKCRLDHQIKEANERWLKPKKKEIPRAITHSRFASGHAYSKEPEYLKKFKHMRG